MVKAKQVAGRQAVPIVSRQVVDQVGLVVGTHSRSGRSRSTSKMAGRQDSGRRGRFPFVGRLCLRIGTLI